MSKAKKLLASALNNPKDVRFSDFVRLLSALGFTQDGGEGSHKVYVHANPSVPFMTVQEGKNGKAKPYQVDQLIERIETHNLEIE